MKHKKALIISFTLASSLMSGHAMAAYAGVAADNAIAGAGLLSTIISPAGNGGAAFSGVDNAKGGIYFFRENIKADKFIKDFDKVVPLEKLSKNTTKPQEIRHINVTGNDVTTLGGNVWYETGSGGAHHLVQIAVEPYSPATVVIPGIGNLIVPGGSDFGDLPDMGAPANDVSVVFPTLESPSVEDGASSLPDLTVSWPDDNSVSAEPSSSIDETAYMAPAVEDTAPPVADAAPAVEDTAPPVADAAPAVEDTAPPVADAAPVVEDTAPPAPDSSHVDVVHELFPDIAGEISNNTPTDNLPPDVGSAGNSDADSAAAANAAAESASADAAAQAAAEAAAQAAAESAAADAAAQAAAQATADAAAQQAAANAAAQQAAAQAAADAAAQQAAANAGGNGVGNGVGNNGNGPPAHSNAGGNGNGHGH